MDLNFIQHVRRDEDRMEVATDIRIRSVERLVWAASGAFTIVSLALHYLPLHP